MHRSLRAAALPILLSILVGAPASGAAPARDWHQALDEILAAPSAADVEGLVGEIVRAAPAWSDVASRIEAIAFTEPPARGEPVLRTSPSPTH